MSLPADLQLEMVRSLPGLSYEGLPGLTREAIERLSQVRPETLGQAGRVPGVTPAAVAVVGFHVERRHRMRDGVSGESRIESSSSPSPVMPGWNR